MDKKLINLLKDRKNEILKCSWYHHGDILELNLISELINLKNNDNIEIIIKDNNNLILDTYSNHFNLNTYDNFRSYFDILSLCRNLYCIQNLDNNNRLNIKFNNILLNKSNLIKNIDLLYELQEKNVNNEIIKNILLKIYK